MGTNYRNLSNQTDLQAALNAKQNTLTIGNLTDSGTDGIIVTGGTGAVIGSGTSLSQHVADTTHSGYLSSTDWNTFNGKQSSLSFIDSISNSGGSVSLSGDASSPGNSKYYGTNGGGTKGFFSLPTTPPGGNINDVQMNDGSGAFRGDDGFTEDGSGNVTALSQTLTQDEGAALIFHAHDAEKKHY